MKLIVFFVACSILVEGLSIQAKHTFDDDSSGWRLNPAMVEGTYQAWMSQTNIYIMNFGGSSLNLVKSVSIPSEYQPDFLVVLSYSNEDNTLIVIGK